MKDYRRLGFSDRVSSGRGAIAVALIGLAYFLAHNLAYLLPDTHTVLAAIWPASGIGLAALLLNPRRRWPAILGVLFVAGNTANLIAGRPLVTSLGFLSADVIESLACAWLISAWGGENIGFGRVGEVSALIFSATLVNACTAMLGAGTASLSHSEPFWSFWRTWWISNGLGILLVAPLIVTWAKSRERLRDLRWQWVLEAGVFLAFWCAVAWMAFQPVAAARYFWPHPYILVAFLSWPALRLGQRSVTLALALLAAIAVTSKAVSVGPLYWGGVNRVERLLAVQLCIGFTTIAGLLLAASCAENRSSERSSREDQARLRALGDNLPNGMVYQALRERNGSSKFLYVSKGSERLTGASAEEILDDPSILYRMVLDEDRPVIAAAEAAAASDMRVFDVVVRIRRRDGEIRWMHLSSSPRKLPDGRMIWDGIQTDITDQKRVEAERTNLERLLQETRRLEGIGILAGGMAHEFNNLLTVINGYSSLLRQSPEIQAPAVQQQVEAIFTAGERAALLTRQLLAFGQRQTLKPRVLNLNTVIADNRAVWMPLLQGNIRLRLELDDALGTVAADPGQMCEVLVNLIKNSVDAMSGGGELVIGTANGLIDEEVAARQPGARPGPCVVLSVADTGVGMDENTRAHIFEPFFTTKNRAAATGLGLATVYGLVAQHQGWITVESALGKGSVFKVHLPCVKQA